MNALPLSLSLQAKEDVTRLLGGLRLAVLEHLSRIAANHSTCSRTTSFPRPPGRESGLWIRQTNKATLLEVLFVIEVDSHSIAVRRILVTEVDRIPDWVIRPDEWGAYDPWPVVDL